MTVEEIQAGISKLCLCERFDQVMLDAQEVYEAVGLDVKEIDEQFPWTVEDAKDEEEQP